MRRQDEEGGRRRRRRKREEEDLCFEPRRGGGRWAKALKRTRCEPHLEVNVLRKSADGRTGARRAEDQKSVAIQRPSFCCAPTWSTSCKSDSETSPPSSGGGRTAKDSCSCLPLSSCLSPWRVLYAERFQCCRIPCSTNCSCCRAGIQEENLQFEGAVVSLLIATWCCCASGPWKHLSRRRFFVQGSAIRRMSGFARDRYHS